MARGRMIDKVVILSKKVNKVSEGAENLYYRLNICADDYGHYYADSEILKGQIYTLRKISLKEISRRVNELWKIGLIKLYMTNGEKYLEIINFEKHQTFKSDRPKKAEYSMPNEFLEPDGIQMEPNGSLSKDKLSKDKLSEEKIAPTDKNRSEPSPVSKIKISFDFKKGEFLNITEEQKKKWALAFPAVDIEGFIKRMEIWQAANPAKRKMNYERAFSNWLSKEQDHGGTKGVPMIPGESRWLKEQREKKEKIDAH